MQEVAAYIIILGLIVLPGYALIRLAMQIMQTVYENQSMLVSFPFP
jgi:hypothetical protein